MGRKPPSTSYRDDPDGVSLHTTPGDEPYLDDASVDPSGNSSSSPPTYEETTRATTDGTVGYTDPDAGKFEHNGLNGRSDGTPVRYQNALADTDPQYLQGWVEYMSRQAPTQYITINGTHSEERRDKEGKKTRTNITDFNIHVSLANYLFPGFQKGDTKMMDLHTVDNGEKTWRGTILMKRAPGAKGDIEVGQVKPTLQEWCHRYCASASKTRIFRLKRTVVGFDEEYVRSRLAGIVRGTNYKGNLRITFPVADGAVDIYSESLLNRWRLNNWICWLFYLTFLWIFSWPVLFFATKRYDVVRAEWSFSRVDAHGSRYYATISEEQWVDQFGPAVKKLACDRYQGTIGLDEMSKVLSRLEYNQGRSDLRIASIVGAARAVRTGRNAVEQVSNLLEVAGGSNDEVGAPWGLDT